MAPLVAAIDELLALAAEYGYKALPSEKIERLRQLDAEISARCQLSNLSLVLTPEPFGPHPECTRLFGFVKFPYYNGTPGEAGFVPGCQSFIYLQPTDNWVAAMQGLRRAAVLKEQGERSSGTSNAGAATPAAAKADQGESNGGAGSTPGQTAVNSGTDRATILRQLQPAERKAYLAYQYAETAAGKRLEDREAHKWLEENGIDTNKGDVGELTDYLLPAFDTWSRQLRNARRPPGEQKYTRRAGRATGRSIVFGRETEYQNRDTH